MKTLKMLRFKNKMDVIKRPNKINNKIEGIRSTKGRVINRMILF